MKMVNKEGWRGSSFESGSIGRREEKEDLADLKASPHLMIGVQPRENLTLHRLFL